MRRFCKRGLPVTLFVIIALLYPLLAPPPHRIDKVHFERIRNGMTRDQVEAIFGVPSGEYDWAEQVETEEHQMVLAAHELLAVISKNGALNREFIQTGQTEPYHPPMHAWTGRHGSVFVAFDEQDRVVTAAMSPEVRIVPPWQRWWRNWKK